MPSGPAVSSRSPAELADRIARRPLLNSKWVEAYSRVGFDVPHVQDVRSMAMPDARAAEHPPVENREHAAIATRKTQIDSQPTLAVSLGMPSASGGVAQGHPPREGSHRVGPGAHCERGRDVGAGMDTEQLVRTTHAARRGRPRPGGDASRSTWRPRPSLRAAAAHLREHPARRADPLPRAHDDAEAGARQLGVLPHAAGPARDGHQAGLVGERFVMTHGVRRRVVDEEGNARSRAPGAIADDRRRRHVAARLAADRRDALVAEGGAWDRAILAVRGITTVERATPAARGRGTRR